MDKHDNVHKVIMKMGRFHPHQNNPYCSSNCDRLTLAQIYKELGFKLGAEIGVRRGRYSEILCKAIPGLELYCIDPWLPLGRKYPKAKQEMFLEWTKKKLAPYNYHILRKTSMDALADIKDASLDFCFIDGDHTFDYVVTDIVFWAKKVKSGGIISCHDYYHTVWNGVVQAVDAYMSAHKIDPWYVTKSMQPTAFWVNP